MQQAIYPGRRPEPLFQRTYLRRDSQCSLSTFHHDVPTLPQRPCTPQARPRRRGGLQTSLSPWLTSVVLLWGLLLPLAAQEPKREPSGEVCFAMSWGSRSSGGYPDLEALFKQQAQERDRDKREALLHQLQRGIAERVMVAPLFQFAWMTAVHRRVAEPSLGRIQTYPYTAPYEDIRLAR